jgi:hypothetical protein
MVMGIANSYQDAVRSATTGMSRWLALTYALNTAEIAMVLGSSMRYDIAEIVGSQIHVAASGPATTAATARLLPSCAAGFNGWQEANDDQQVTSLNV